MHQLMAIEVYVYAADWSLTNSQGVGGKFQMKRMEVLVRKFEKNTLGCPDPVKLWVWLETNFTPS